MDLKIATIDNIINLKNLINKAYRPKDALKSKCWTHESDIVSGDRINNDQILELIHRPKSFILMYFQNDELISCIHLEQVDNSCYIGTFAVDPDFQGLNIGKKMLIEAENIAKSHFKIERFIMVVVSERQELIDFYIRRGYSETNTIEDYPIFAGVGMPKKSNLTIKSLEKIII